MDTSLVNREQSADYNDIVVSEFDAEEVRRAKIELWIAKRLCTKLLSHFPMRDWKVLVDTGGGIVAVSLDSISKDKGYVISLKRTVTEIEGMMLRIGGEILERGGLSTAKNFNPDDIEILERDANDNAVSSDLETPEDKHAKAARESRT